MRLDADCLFTLQWQGLSPDTIPDAGSVWLANTINDPLASKGELRTVYNTDVTDEVCPSIRSTCEAAAQVLGSDFVGVDFIAKNARQSLEESGGVINEVNTTPALHHHHVVDTDPIPPVAIQTLELALNRAEQRAIQSPEIR